MPTHTTATRAAPTPVAEATEIVERFKMGVSNDSAEMLLGRAGLAQP